MTTCRGTEADSSLVPYARIGAWSEVYATHSLVKGEQYYEERYRDRVIKNLKRRAKDMGFEMVALTEKGGAENCVETAT